jgi:hypothetical protein
MALLHLLRFRLSLLRVVLTDLASRTVHGARFVITAMPVAGGEGPPADPPPPPPADPPAGDPPAGDPPADPPADPPGGDPPADPPPADPDWKTQSRKHERNWKNERKAREDAEAKLKEFETANASEQEKAIAKAREDATAEVTSKFEQERRQDRLEVATTRVATKGVTLGEGDDAKTVKFADPEDALVHLERAISRGDIDGDEIFDGDGKVQTAALTTALTELLGRKPHLAAQDGGKAPKVEGSADGGKGAATPDPDATSVDDELKNIRRHQKAA